MVEFLVASGADSSIQDEDGETALDYAKKYEWVELIEILESVTQWLLHDHRFNSFTIGRDSFIGLVLVEILVLITTQIDDKIIDVM